jgi:hypothetical protein
MNARTMPKKERGGHRGGGNVYILIWRIGWDNSSRSSMVSLDNRKGVSGCDNIFYNYLKIGQYQELQSAFHPFIRRKPGIDNRKVGVEKELLVFELKKSVVASPLLQVYVSSKRAYVSCRNTIHMQNLESAPQFYHNSVHTGEFQY